MGDPHFTVIVEIPIHGLMTWMFFSGTLTLGNQFQNGSACLRWNIKYMLVPPIILANFLKNPSSIVHLDLFGLKIFKRNHLNIGILTMFSE